MDLPPPITQQPRVATQNRPSIGYLVFISLLFYLITNSNSSSGPVPDPSTASSELGRLRSDLLRRVQRRDGLASYLGLNDTKARELPSWALPDALVFNVTVPPDGEGEGEGESEDGRVANATLYSAIPFDPAGGGNKAIVPFVQSIVENPLGASLFAQNVTGFVKGTWTMRQLSLADLGLTETHNTTAQVEHEVQGEVEEQGEGDVAASTEETGPSRVERRRLARVDDGFDAGAVWKRQAGGGGGLLGTAVNAADTVSWSNQSLPVYQTVNETVVHNRTADRGPYPWSKGGKLNFNLREERQSAWAYDSEEEGRMALLTAADGDGWAGQGPVTFLSGDMTFTSFDGQNDFVFDVEGAHFLSQGSVFGYASPQNDRRSQLFNVPGLAVVDSPAGPDSGLGSTKARAKVGAMGRMVVAQIDRRIEQDRDEIEQHRDGRFPPQGADLAGAQPGAGQFGSADVAPCIFALFGQLAPLPRNYTPDMYLEYYRSLLRPRGTSLAPPPAPRMEYTLYSENCGLVLEGEGAGLSSYRLWEQATGYATVMAVVQAMLLVLLVRQIEWGGASAGGRVAYMTIGLQAAVDSYFFVVHFTVGVATRNRSSLTLLVPAFFALLSSVIFGMRYASSIRASQPTPHHPTPAPLPPPAPAPAPASAPARSPGEGEHIARAESEAAEEEAEEDAEFNAELAAAEALLNPRSEQPTAVATAPPPALLQVPPAHELGYVGLAVGVAVGVFGFILLAGWLPFILALVYSYWIPQVVLNVRRGSARSSLAPVYVVGTTAARLVLPLYVWAFADNVLSVTLSVEPSRWVWLLVLYSALQAATLILQGSGAGARWFLPARAKAWLEVEEEDKWDYHPAELTAQAEENAREEACAICLEKVDLPAKEDRELKRGRASYMVPPCNHIAHTVCLMGWLEIKSVCPVCRGRLPSP